jgi:hypothetical protein
MNFDKFAKNLLAEDNRIVFVGIISDHFKLLYSTFREGVKLHSDHKAIQKFMSLSSQLTMDELEKKRSILGPISTVLVRFAKRVFVLSRFNGNVIVVGLDVEVPTPLPNRIAKLIKTAASSAPDLPIPPQNVQVFSSADI